MKSFPRACDGPDHKKFGSALASVSDPRSRGDELIFAVSGRHDHNIMRWLSFPNRSNHCPRHDPSFDAKRRRSEPRGHATSDIAAPGAAWSVGSLGFSVWIHPTTAVAESMNRKI